MADKARFDSLHLDILRQIDKAGIEGTTVKALEKGRKVPIIQKIEELLRGRLIEKADEEEGSGRLVITARGGKVLSDADAGKVKPKKPDLPADLKRELQDDPKPEEGQDEEDEGETPAEEPPAEPPVERVPAATGRSRRSGSKKG
jgi:hypothetical protein